MTPRPQLLRLLSLVLPLLVAGIWMPPLRQVALPFNAVVILIAALDLMVTASLKFVHVSREVSPVLSVGTWNTVRLTARNMGRRTVSLACLDEPPEPGLSTGGPVTFSLQAGQTRSGDYQFQPHRRGRSSFAAVHIRSISRWGFWMLLERRELSSPVRILPDIRSVYRYELMARRNRLEELGIKIRRLRGQGNEFERLRDYRREDDPRNVDWKATARNQRLISREFNVERNQNILVVVDCGRSMRNELDGVSYLDRALNASIMLSYLALGQGDNVGFVAFSSRIERSLKAVRGKPAIQAVLQSGFDLEARRDTSDYRLMMEHLGRHFRKRSLVVLLTHVIDEQHLDAICQPLQSMQSPHLVLCLFLKDLGLTSLATRVPETDVEAFQSAAAAELLTAVERRTSTLKEYGILTISTLPDTLTADVINGYLDVKARHLL